MENGADPPAKEAQDEAEVVDIAKKKEEKEEGEKKEREKEEKEEEKDNEKKKVVEEDTPRSLKTMSPSEKVSTDEQ